MNAIEQRFYDAFGEYLKESPKVSIHSDSWEMKIAEYSVQENSIEIEQDRISANINTLFPTLHDEIKENCIEIYLTPQDCIGAYIIDFSLIAEGFTGQIINLAIEIDGHDFHEKNKEQASNDKRRDREIALRDYVVLRFTGSEIYTNATKCVQEVFNILTTLVFERYMKYPDFYIGESIYFNKVVSGEIK